MATQIPSNMFPLGWIQPVPGTPMDLFENYPALRDEQFYVNLIMIQAGPNNVGSIWIGNQTLVRATNTGVIYVLTTAGDSFILGNYAVNILEAMKFRIDSELAGDGVYVSVYVR